MIQLGVWKATLVFALIYSVIILIPCVLVTLLGVRMINNLGQYPSRTPAIQLGIFWKLVLIEILSFSVLIGYHNILVN